jgi:inosine-uridine nucleoside N-ribohydrolase
MNSPGTPASNARQRRRKVFVDTDVGSDLDDALALAYLLANDDSELVGITTTTGDTPQRARIASMICRHAGVSVPIHSGERDPLIGIQRQPDVPQSGALASWNYAEPAGDEGAAFLVDTVRASPGEITLLCIAPLSTVGRAILIEPDLCSLLASVVVMGGNFFHRPDRPPIEWNLALDPAAARLLYQQDACPIRTISLDVTHDVAWTKHDLAAAAAQAPILNPVVDLSVAHFPRYPQVYLHDPLAAATIFVPDICGYRHGTVIISGPTETDAGRSVLEASSNTDHTVTESVDSQRFVHHIADTPATARYTSEITPIRPR